MYLLYLDESGNEADPTDRHFVLGGLAVFERNTFFLSNRLDEIQDARLPGTPPVAFHATEIRSGKGFWRRVPADTKQAILDDVVGTISRAAQSVHLFAAVVEKSASLHGEAAVEYATAEVCRRFDILLKRRYHEHDDAQRGLVIFSEGRFDKRARVWVRDFRKLGTAWGVLNNLADIPYFASMRENRLLQLADFVSHAAFLLYERRDPTLIRPFLSRFDQKDGILHGLTHARPPGAPRCDCPACFSRRVPGTFGPWV